MISYLAPLPAGDAVELLLSPPAGARRWRVLRKRADSIAAADDPGSNVVFDGTDKFIIDRDPLLVNGTTYYYRAFYLTNAGWQGSDTRSVVPQATGLDLAVDAVDVVQARVEAGFNSYVQRGLLTHPSLDVIPVLFSAPDYEGAQFPLVTVNLTADSPAHRFVGESFGEDVAYIGDDEEVDAVGELQGYLSQQQIQIIVWSLNGDERKAMRKALKAIVLANLPMFAAAGMDLIEPQFGEVDDVTTYPRPMYQAICTVSCIAPAAVERRHSVITEATLAFIETQRTTNG